MKYVAGTIHLALGNVQRATAHLSGALQPENLMIDAAYSLALIALDDNRPGEARQHLEHYLRVRPEGQFAKRAKNILSRLDLVAVGTEQ
jgi:tetratricopeptide (TPR) repeat protein